MIDTAKLYNLKPTPELIWAVLTIVVSVVGAAVATQGAVPPTDWRGWAIGVAAALVRALGGLFLSGIPSSSPRSNL